MTSIQPYTLHKKPDFYVQGILTDKDIPDQTLFSHPPQKVILLHTFCFCAIHETLSLRGRPYQPFNHRVTLLEEDFTFPQETLPLRGQPYQP